MKTKAQSDELKRTLCEAGKYKEFDEVKAEEAEKRHGGFAVEKKVIGGCREYFIVYGLDVVEDNGVGFSFYSDASKIAKYLNRNWLKLAKIAISERE